MESNSPIRMSVAGLTRRIAKALMAANLKVVFAESCTGGLVSGALTRVPGISAHHCGGVVVYRNATKQAWLGVPDRLLTNPGPVSARMSEFLAQAVLDKTPEADIALAITGHLGPDAPPALDGHVFLAIAWRRAIRRKSARSSIHHLQCRTSQTRVARQKWAVEQALNCLALALEASAT
jgi:PncC family amidohydrolase